MGAAPQFSGGSIYRMEVPDPHRICYDPHTGQNEKYIYATLVAPRPILVV